MKTKIYTLILALSTVSAFSQVGINTPNPTATLDVNGTLKIRDTPMTPALPGYTIMAVNDGTFQVAKVDPQVIIDAATAASGTNTSVYAAKKTTGITLLSLGLFPTGFRAVNFLAAERSVGSAALFSDTDNTFTIPSNGVYQVGFTFRYGAGLQAAILTNTPGIGILRTRGGVATLIDSRVFSGLTVPLVLSLTISESTLNSLYSFQAGDKISFGLTGSSALDVGLLGTSIGSFYIYKVSN
ncbi:hypothetical protein [Chryseobacterium carnipullorum]|uniref:hypothetical protein n=1 Tax=Chryseobacterium carnipullorum TaxID=1124835 RepID=UPI0009244AD3|nr:hypothetical protein [Chryseobacterium carnipullorum]SHM57785.1 hypothetical protein SAMN05444360_1149 [Chryseobacterium carnipullorum]HBV14523.1 hypothetical protein [Chryseobacterium carnipullorum]